MPKFGVSIYSISRKIISGEITPVEGVKILSDFGAQTIELVPFGFDMIKDPSLIDKFLKVSDETKVPIENYSLNANFLLISDEEYKAEVSRVKQHIDVADKLSIPTIRVDCAGFRRPIHENTIENFQKELPLIIDTYENLCEYANKYNITVLIENHGFHANGAERVRQILTSVKAKNFSHQLDTGNYVCVDDCAVAAVKKVMEFATTIHMKDFYIRTNDPGDATQFDCSGSWFRSVSGKYLRGSIMGQGDLDIPTIMGLIKQPGFDGNIYIEFEGMEDCLYGTKVSLDNMIRIYDSV